MYAQLSALRRWLLTILIGAMLAGCGAAPSSVPPDASPVVTPSAAATSAAPSASAAPTVEPSPTSVPSPTPSPSASAAPSASATPDTAQGVLPAPLLFMREGQIVRMERDGKIITPLTSEQPGQPDILAVISFDVSPVDGALVYVVQGREGNILVRTDATGQQRTVLLPSAPVNNVRWSPDGTQIALQMSDPAEPGAGPAGGVYLLPASGGEPQLLQPNDRNDPASPSPDARGYMPHAWSPDGKQLLLAAYSLTVEVCSAAVKDLASGTLVPIQAPAGMVSGCASGQWSVDGRTIYTQMARPGPQPPVPGLWQADPQTGTITPFIQGELEGGKYQVVTNQRPLKDGSVYAFMAVTGTLPEPFSGEMLQYKLFQGSQTDGRFLRDEQFPVVGQALWAPDNSGAVVDMPQGDGGDVITAWLPINGPVVELGKFMGEAKHWARN